MLRIDLHHEDHQFRNESEVTRDAEMRIHLRVKVRKESKGGYLKGDIIVNGDLLRSPSPVFLTLSLIAGKEDEENNPHNIHPNLIYFKGWKCRIFPRQSRSSQASRVALK